MNWLTENIDIEQLVTGVIERIPAVLAAIGIMIAFSLLYRVTRRPLEAGLKKTGLHPALVHSLVDSVYRITIIVFALVMAADQLGINIGAALAGIGVAGIAIGFAAQDSIANVIAGFMIFIDKPFELGDWVTVSDLSGEISAITLRSTRIRTPNNTYVVMPNKMVIDAVLVNHSKHGATRVDIGIGIAYKEHIPKAREVLLRAMEGVEGLRTEPASEVVVTELGDSSVNLDVRVWIDEPSRTESITSSALEAGKLALDDAGIQIPFPHLQLFVDNVEDNVWRKAAGIVPFASGS